MLLLNFYVNCVVVAICGLLLVTKYVMYHPYFIVSYCVTVPLCCLFPVLSLSYDPEKVTKKKAPASSKTTREKPTSLDGARDRSSTKSSTNIDLPASDPPTKKEPDHMELA